MSLSLSLFIPLTTEPSSTAFIVVSVCVSLSLSLSLSPSPSLSLSRYVPSSLLSVSLSVNEGRKTLTFKRASEGEHGALSTLSRYSPSLLVSLALPSSPLAARYRPVFSTAAFKLWRWPSSLSLSHLASVTLYCFFTISRIAQIAPVYRHFNYYRTVYHKNLPMYSSVFKRGEHKIPSAFPKALSYVAINVY